MHPNEEPLTLAGMRIERIPELESLQEAKEITHCDNITLNGSGIIELNFHGSLDVLKILENINFDKPGVFSMEWVAVVSEKPKRFHRKKRIQKKWNKRYGVIQYIDKVTLKNCTLIPRLSADAIAEYTLFGEKLEVSHDIRFD